MANNYTQATMVPTEVFLTPAQEAYLRATGARFDHDEAPAPLHQLADAANETPTAVRRSYVYWEENFDECVDPETLEDELSDAGYESEFGRYVNLSIEDFFRHVLRQPENADLGYLRVEGTFSCSKMRPGEFGGFVLTVTRDEYCWCSTHMVQVEDGKIRPLQVEVHKFEEEE